MSDREGNSCPNLGRCVMDGCTGHCMPTSPAASPSPMEAQRPLHPMQDGYEGSVLDSSPLIGNKLAIFYSTREQADAAKAWLAAEVEAAQQGHSAITPATLALASDRKASNIMRALNIFGANVTLNQPLDLALIGAALSNAGCRLAAQPASAVAVQPSEAVTIWNALDAAAKSIYNDDSRETVREFLMRAWHHNVCPALNAATPIQASVAPSDDAPCERDECWLHEKCIGLCARAAAAPLPPPSAPQPVAWRWRFHTDDSLAGRPNVRAWLLADKEPTSVSADIEVEPLYTRPASAPVGVRGALRNLLDAIHAGRLVVLNSASAGYVASVIEAGESALASLTEAAPAAQRMPLSDEKILRVFFDVYGEDNTTHAVPWKFARAIEAAHGIQEANNADGGQGGSHG